MKKEIKESVKQRIIDMLAEQIIKEEKLNTLKSEIISELLDEEPTYIHNGKLNSDYVSDGTKEKIEITQLDEKKLSRNSKWMDEFGFTFNSDVVEKVLEDKAKFYGKKSSPIIRREVSEMIKDVKQGKIDEKFMDFPVDNSIYKYPEDDLNDYYSNKSNSVEDTASKFIVRNLIKEKMLNNYKNDYSSIKVDDIKKMEYDTNYKRRPIVPYPVAEPITTENHQTTELAVTEETKKKKSYKRKNLPVNTKEAGARKKKNSNTKK